jgi:hypothetical protein
MARGAVKTTKSAEFAEGIIDLFAGVWICTDHNTKMHVGHECAWCATEKDGIQVLEKLAG